MYVYVNIYIHIYIYIHVHVYINIYIHVFLHTHMTTVACCSLPWHSITFSGPDLGLGSEPDNNVN